MSDKDLRLRFKDCTAEERFELCRRHVLPPFYDPNELTMELYLRDYRAGPIRALVESIESEGQSVPIILNGNKVIDGWFRVLACRELDIPVLGSQLTSGYARDIINMNRTIYEA